LSVLRVTNISFASDRRSADACEIIVIVYILSENLITSPVSHPKSKYSLSNLLSQLAARQDTWDLGKLGVYRLNPLKTGRLIKALSVQCRVAVQLANDWASL
jgi:hypothetical protein